MQHIYGILPVLEALRAGKRNIERIIIAKEARQERLREVIQNAKAAGITIRLEPRVALDRISGKVNNQGVVAIAAAVSYVDAEGILDSVTKDSLYILLDGVEDPHNLGAIIRTAECAGATAVIIPERRSAHVTETVAKTSAGAIDHLPVARVTNLVSFIEKLKNKGVWVAGVEQSGKTVYTDYDYAGGLALVFGGEGRGLHKLVARKCDALLSIPMYGKVDSLNVSVAVGVVLFEAIRQRNIQQLTSSILIP